MMTKREKIRRARSAYQEARWTGSERKIERAARRLINLLNGWAK